MVLCSTPWGAKWLFKNRLECKKKNIRHIKQIFFFFFRVYDRSHQAKCSNCFEKISHRRGIEPSELPAYQSQLATTSTLTTNVFDNPENYFIDRTKIVESQILQLAVTQLDKLPAYIRVVARMN